jgi:hypothetical protein
MHYLRFTLPNKKYAREIEIKFTVTRQKKDAANSGNFGY